jgi:uncharacterized protein with HEPN domain
MDKKIENLLKELLYVTERTIKVASHFSSFEELAEDKLAYDTVLANVTVIYEIDQKIPEKIKENELSSIAWKRIKEYKEEIQSDFHDLNTGLLWQAVSEDLPILKIKLEQILK